jgi:hypothetical protein
MISFEKPKQLNGTQLNKELAAAGVKLSKSKIDLPNTEYEPPVIDGNGVLWLDIEQSDANKATEVLAAHIGKDPEPKTLEEKLASVGLNLNDLKSALGL